MTIYYDISEGRSGTRLQEEVRASGKPLDNLEMITGTDLLITPYEHNLIIPRNVADAIVENNTEIIANRHLIHDSQELSKAVGIPLPIAVSVKHFWIACQKGILIQRKSGMDYPSSIPKLNEIFGRMLLWTPDPWLLISANIGCDRNGKAVIDGKTSGFKYSQLIGAKISWMMSGGNVVEIPRDNLTALIVNYIDSKLIRLEKDDTKFVVRQKWTRQNIVGPNDKRWEWMNVLIQLPGIGQKRTKALADYAGNLASAIEFLNDTEAVKTLGRNDIARTVDSLKFRKLLGFDDEHGDQNKMVIIGYKDE